ncbi:MAG: PLP-dependent aminotransferase family protein [Betaproteobacteria bacterium]
MPSPAPQFSRRIADLHPSPIREILARVQEPGMISFAGGLPAEESFPDFAGDFPREAMQYGPSEGEPELRAQIGRELRDLGLACDDEQVLILSGSQQGIDLVAKLFIDGETPVAVESPTYLAALQAFRFFGARFLPYRADQLIRLEDAGAEAAFTYVIPTFQNPTGHCYSREERRAFATICDQNGLPVFEDDPYRDLVFGPCDRTPICAHLRQAPWIYQGSFSKSLAPGLRLGYLAASRELLPFLVRLKQAADLHSNRLSQALVLRQLQHPGRAARMAGLADRYRTKRDRFAASLNRHFADLADWQVPQGGLFFWLRLRRQTDTRLLLEKALAAGVAFMPGESFYPIGDTAEPSLRLNFSFASPDETERGLETLAAIVRSGV